eukprot:gnl/Chilomastix_cuspidata/10649.p2 GENE.gnl/Chilomastix_cuspidata/10649~~gnl/Chilomastix_cuspidata/10649.p2  ORF type:complete len:103 (-),score=4.91 gnl/Chilomastix_cuspidata/10649:629-937(-)
MSRESAKAFYEKLQQDEDLSKKIEELKKPDAIKEYIQGELGYDFTQEEMQQVIFEKNPELTDEELEAVVGGVSDDMVYGVAIGVGIGGGMGVVALAIAAAGA